MPPDPAAAPHERDQRRIAIDASGWDRSQQSLVRMIAPLTIDQLHLASAPEKSSVGTVAAHIVAARSRWWNLRMGEGGELFGALAQFDREGIHDLTAAKIVSALETTSKVMLGTLARWTLADLDVRFIDARHPDRRPRTRAWIISHVLHRDVLRSVEISQILAVHGIAGQDI